MKSFFLIHEKHISKQMKYELNLKYAVFNLILEAWGGSPNL